MNIDTINANVEIDSKKEVSHLMGKNPFENHKILKYTEDEFFQWLEDAKKYHEKGELLKEGKLYGEPLYYLIISTTKKELSFAEKFHTLIFPFLGGK